jgi:CO/xanthine dehydrogenase Mo-binding subunit
MDVPAIEVIWTDIPDPHSPLGAHGIGEKSAPPESGLGPVLS